MHSASTWRKKKVAAGYRERGMAVHSCKDAVLHERGEVLKGDGTPYRVYTPYSKAWHRLEKPAPLPRVRAIHTPKGIASLEPPTLATWNLPDPEADVIEPGERAARDRMRAALDGPLHRYSEDRDIPGGQTTSRLSQDLRLGLISIRELFAKADERARAARTAEERKAFQTYINELAWREFYMQILYHFPEVLEHEFNADYRALKWSYDDDALGRWKAGETGFPIVDAGMRQLRATGFMHNRVRMITAMFLTKDLHLDWRLGEEYFMQQLTDGEIASNNGGWQWSAGTGADAAPYFRIQNPWSQTKRFDTHGDYIKAWVPELKDVPAKKFLNPPEDGKPIAKGYPAPIVDHAEAREKTLAMFKAAK
ncbi:MAG: deoxyribodipyrimidine photo-lyase [Verrucomicrobiales bacterium]